MEIVKKIKSLAQERGIKLNFICTQLGLTSRTYFHDIEKNGRTIPADKLSIIADILNTTPEYLLGLTDKKEKPTAEAVGNDDQLFTEAEQLMGSLSPARQEEAMRYLRYLASQEGKDTP